LPQHMGQTLDDFPMKRNRRHAQTMNVSRFLNWRYIVLEKIKLIGLILVSMSRNIHCLCMMPIPFHWEIVQSLSHMPILFHRKLLFPSYEFHNCSLHLIFSFMSFVDASWWDQAIWWEQKTLWTWFLTEFDMFDY